MNLPWSHAGGLLSRFDGLSVAEGLCSGGSPMAAGNVAESRGTVPFPNIPTKNPCPAGKWRLCATVAGMVLFGCELHSSPLPAQNIELRAQGTSFMQSATVSLNTAGISDPIQIRFDLAFATSEVRDPQTFVDSFTISFRPAKDGPVAALLTVDVFDLQLLPPNPGGLELPGGSLQAAPIDYFGGLDDPTFRSAYSVLFNVPIKLLGADGEVDFVLFDNENNLFSAAYIRQFSIIPEPGILSLFALGCLGLFLFSSARK